MGTVTALGEWALVGGFALAGVETFAAEDAEEVRAAWDALPPDAVVILTPSAAEAVGEADRHTRLTVVMPA